MPRIPKGIVGKSEIAMHEQYQHIPLIVGGLIALILQIVLSPFITIGYAMPNFVVAFTVAYAIAAPNRRSPVVAAFVLGLLYNLFCGGVIGGMSFALTLVCFVLTRLFSRFDESNVPMALIGIVVAVLIVEVLYGIISILCGVQGGLLEALVYRALPCALYDCVLGIIAYLIVSRFVTKETTTKSVASVRLR